MSKLSCFDRQTAGRSERPLRASYDATARPRCLRLLRAGGGSENGQGERPPDDLPSLRLWLTLIQRSLRALQFEGQLQPLLGEISEHWGPRWCVIRER